MIASPRPAQVPDDWLRPTWTAAAAVALMTTRVGGESAPPFGTMNLRDGLGDDPAAVRRNRQRLSAAIGGRPVWLDQVHGTAVVRLRPGDDPAARRTGDASVATDPNVVCAVQVADCLPVLFATHGGARPAVAAAHAGWRGLAAGVLEATLAALCDAAGARPGQVEAWLGPCIGPRHFEVGDDVRTAFAGADPRRFVVGCPGKWHADLAGLARDRLRAAGVAAVTGGDWCTYAAPERFFSYRRDGVTGRMAAAIRLPDGAPALAGLQASPQGCAGG